MYQKLNNIFRSWIKFWVKIVIFINYSKNSKEVTKLEKFLRKFYGVLVFKAPSSIEPGSNYIKDLKNNIINCDLFIPIISSNSIKSSITQQEIGIAVSYNKDIFPIVLGKISEKELGFLINKQYIRYKDPSLKKKLKNKILKKYLTGYLIFIVVVVIWIYFRFFR